MEQEKEITRMHLEELKRRTEYNAAVADAKNQEEIKKLMEKFETDKSVQTMKQQAKLTSIQNKFNTEQSVFETQKKETR